MKHILYLITQSELGGAQAYVAALATAAVEKNYQVTIASGGDMAAFTDLPNTISQIKLPALKREISPLNDFMTYRAIKKLCHKIKPDVVHLNSTKAGILGAIAARHAGVKNVIYTVHGFVFNEPLPSWKKNLYISLERFSAKYKNHLICVSKFDQTQALAYRIAPENKCLVIPNGITPDARSLNRQDARATLGLNQDDFVIGSIANLYPTKGISYLLEAFAQLKTKNLKLYIIGNGPEEKSLVALAHKLKITDAVMFAGQRKNARQLLSAFDIYVQSSAKEGFPLAILEAMDAQLPIVATNVGGVPEIIEDQKTGLLIEAGSVDVLVNAITKFLDNPILAQTLGKNAKQTVTEKFDLNTTVKKTFGLY